MIDMNKVSMALTLTNAKLNALSTEKYNTLKASVDVPLEPLEIVKYQNLKAIAQIEQKISLEVALWIYTAIEHWAKTTLGEKILITQMIAGWAGILRK
jgi:hypothetical protein